MKQKRSPRVIIKARRRRSGFTLVEMVLNLVVLSVVMGAVSSAIVIASRSVPNEASASVATGSAFAVVEQMASDLFGATAFNSHDAHSVEFQVADRDNDGDPETILYGWSGVPGEPLRRQYNGGLSVEVAENVQEFALTYTTRSESETTQVVSLSPGSETLLATFDNWLGGILSSLTNNPVSLADFQAEAFTLSPPGGAVRVTFTRASLQLSREGAAATSDQYSVAIHASAGDGLLANQPASTPLGTPTLLTSATIPGTYMANAVTFNTDMLATDLSRTRFWLVLRGTGSNRVYAQGRYSLLAPLDSTLQRWSTDSGASWQPAVDLLNTQDLRFSVYGYYSTETVTEEVSSRQYMSGVGITLRLGPAFPETADQEIKSRRWTTTVQTVNAPQVFTLDLIELD